LNDSTLVPEVERIVAWAWEELTTVEARIERVGTAIDRIDRLSHPGRSS
jgi:hypothetical protein